MNTIIFIFFIISNILILSISTKPKYSSNLINVHLVPHTHNDVGWLKTVDQYYMGLNNTIQKYGAQYILDSIIPALQLNKNRKFIYVEMAFLYRWWNQQDDEMKNDVKELIASGQLEIINGGYLFLY